jgi:L-fucose isomerase-like protein
MFFRLGGGTIKGVSKPGEIVWSRVFIEDGKLKIDIGRGGVVRLPKKETERRWEATCSQWPIMHGVTYGVSRDEFMAKHKANHIQVAYARDAKSADNAVLVKAAMAASLGMEVNLCGTRKDGKKW